MIKSESEKMSKRQINGLRNPFRSSDGQALLLPGFLPSVPVTPHSTPPFEPSSPPMINNSSSTTFPELSQHSSASRVRPRSGSEDIPSDLSTLKEEEEPTKPPCRKPFR